MSTHADAQRAAEQVMLAAETKEAGRLLGAAGFTELPGIREGARVGFRVVGEFYELAILFPDGHMEAIRQVNDSPLSALWTPGGEQDFEWMKSGEPLEVVQELLALPSS